MELCDWCGNPLPAGARFCPTCGAPVGPVEADTGQPAAVLGQGGITERKVVTVLFADVVRSTELAAMLDPERFSEVMAAFFQMVERELTSLRGRAEKFVGDAVLAVFGVPHAHEDDALRAVRAALFIRDRTARLGERLALPVPLRVRIGINSGPVAAGPEATGWSGVSIRPLISGATVNLAARLQQAADPGEILIGETTRQLVRHMVAIGDERDVAAKGFGGPVHGWPVTGLAPRMHRRTIPLIGRRTELGLLEQTFDRVRESGHATLATVLGEPGIGKSRLVDEFLVQLPSDVKVMTGRSGDFEEDPAFAPIAEMLRRELGLDRDAPSEEFRERLEEVVAGCCDVTEVEQTAARLGLALGLTEPSREGRRFRAAELRAGFVSFLHGLTRGGPVVMVFEDIHVARQSLLDVVDQLLEGARELPVMVVAVARDSLLESRPTWGSHPESVSLRLDPLPMDEAGELARAAAESIDDATAARIATNTGGNPFFIVETTGMMLDEHTEHVQGAPHSHVLPPTVQAVVASRIDHLPDDARELFRKASVFSMLTFEESDLALVASTPDLGILQTLEQAELLVRDADRPGEWRFRHEMLRDVAYESLPKRERVRLHVGIVDRMREAGTIDRHPQGVAWHLEHAAVASLDLNPQDRTLAERAVDALAHAGDVARWRIESRTAIDLYDRALALAGDEASWSTQEARILSTRGEAMYWLGRFDDAAASLARALEVGEVDVWTVAHASRFLGDIELNVRARPEDAAALFDRAVVAAEELDDPWAISRALLMAAWVPYWRGEYDAARSMFERALQLARENPERDRWAEARALTSLTSVISPAGDERESLELAREALELGRAMMDPFTIAVAQQSIANSLRRMLELEEAHRYADQAYRTFHDLGARWEEASAQSDRGSIRRLLGDLDGAEGDLRETIRISRELGERTLPTWTVDRLVLVLVMRREFAKARAELAEALDSIEPDDLTFRDTFLTSDVLLLLVEGHADEARERAIRLLETRRSDGLRNEIASTTWWVARLFGADLVGGEDVAEEARATLEKAGWVQFVREPELLAEVLGEAAASA